MTARTYTSNDLRALAREVGDYDGSLGFYTTRGRFDGYEIRAYQSVDVRWADDPVLFQGPIRECRAWLLGFRAAQLEPAR